MNDLANSAGDQYAQGVDPNPRQLLGQSMKQLWDIATGRPRTFTAAEKVFYDWLRSNGVDEWVPERPYLLVRDGVVRELVYSSFVWSGPRGWDSEHIAPGLGGEEVTRVARTVPLLVSVSPELRQACAEGGFKLVEEDRENGPLVWVMIGHDRHLSPQAYPFSDPETAAQAAWRWVRGNASPDAKPAEVEVAGHLLHVRYSPDGGEFDDAWVVERRLDGAVTEGWRGI